MSLWNIIRDWFVEYIFGGYNFNGDFFPVSKLGYVTVFNNGVSEEEVNYNLTDYWINLGQRYDGLQVSITFADWLSTTATLIVMISICVGLFFLVRYFFRMFAGLLSNR